MPDSPKLGATQITARLALIGAIVAATAGAFAYDAGVFSPRRLTQDKIMARFAEVSGGVHPGFRRNHAKGVCATGTFASSGQAARLSKAAVFRQGSMPVVARFSFGGGMPFVPDKPAAVRALALRVLPSDGQEWRTGMINMPVFPVRSARGFYEFLLATAPDPKTGKPNPDKIGAVVAAHPETGAALGLIKAHAPSAGFDDTTYNALNAFRFVAADGTTTPVRWSAVPDQAATPADTDSKGPNYLFEALGAAIRQHPLHWHLIVSIGEPGDPTNDATLPWPDSRRKVDAGIITIDALHSEDEDEDGRCVSVNYDPIILPDGITPSDDPLLSARSAAYAKSFTLRSGETKPPSMVTPADVKGDRS